MGKVYLVGAGPGDPGLITVKGMELLKICDAVIYDRLASYELLEYVREDCVKIYAGKESGHHTMAQDEINAAIIQNAGKYDTLVRLKGGDPFVFGRGGEEAEALVKNGISFEIIPGVTSAVSVPETAGIPVTQRGVSQSFHVITGHSRSSETILTDNYEILSKLEGTLVFLMGLSNIGMITDELIKNGKDENTPVAVISYGTMENQKTIRGDLSNIASVAKEEKMLSPAVIVIGETAAFDFTDKKNKPLSDMNIGITGTKTIREKLKNGFRELGAKAYTVCNMHVKETAFAGRLNDELSNIAQYRWIVFTSRNAIGIFFDEMDKGCHDRRKLSTIKFAVIGSGTKDELKKYGIYPDLVPAEFTAKALAAELAGRIGSGEKALIPRALQGSRELAEIFDQKGISYKDLRIYDVEGELTDNKKYIPEMDCLIFASASGADAFFKGIKGEGIRLREDVKIACIGDITAKSVRKYVSDADIIASTSDAAGLLDAVCEFFSHSNYQMKGVDFNDSYEKAPD